MIQCLDPSNKLAHNCSDHELLRHLTGTCRFHCAHKSKHNGCKSGEEDHIPHGAEEASLSFDWCQSWANNEKLLLMGPHHQVVNVLNCLRLEGFGRVGNCCELTHLICGCNRFLT